MFKPLNHITYRTIRRHAPSDRHLPAPSNPLVYRDVGPSPPTTLRNKTLCRSFTHPLDSHCVPNAMTNAHPPPPKRLAGLRPPGPPRTCSGAMRGRADEANYFSRSGLPALASEGPLRSKCEDFRLTLFAGPERKIARRALRARHAVQSLRPPFSFFIL